MMSLDRRGMRQRMIAESAMPRRVMQSPQAPATVKAPPADLDLSPVAAVVAEIDPKSSLITVLQRVQDAFGYLPEAVVDEIARLSDIPASRIYGIVTFYAQFSTEPSGKHRVFVCHGTACHVAGATRVTQAVEQELDVTDGETTPDMSFTLGSVACMGACSQAPVMRIDEETYGNLSADQTRKAIRDFVKELGLEAPYLGPAGAGSARAGGGDD
jgi:NADH-quinone oxidoreductase subunit E